MGYKGHPGNRKSTSELLRDMTRAAQDFSRTRGKNRLAALGRYIDALRRFNDRVLAMVEAPRHRAAIPKRNGLPPAGH
jgi:hypothetical protein